MEPATPPVLRPIIGSPIGLPARLRAFALDYLIIAMYLLVIIACGMAGVFFIPEAIETLFATRWSGQLTGFALVTLPVTLYFAASEAAPSQATWGKRRIGLRVSKVNGEPMTWSRSLGRALLKFVPWELSHSCIWYVSAAVDPSPAVYGTGFTIVWLLVGANIVSVVTSKRHQALYDRIAGTMVTAAKTIG